MLIYLLQKKLSLSDPLHACMNTKTTTGSGIVGFLIAMYRAANVVHIVIHAGSFGCRSANREFRLTL